MLVFAADRFIQAYSAEYGEPRETQLAGISNLLNFINLDLFMSDLRWAAYMLATVKHECADTWQPIEERGSTTYFKKYEPPSQIATNLGNTQKGDGLKFKGRGYVQLTGRANYVKMSKALGFGTGLVDDVNRVLDPEVSYMIMSHGMRNGVFTGKRLSTYIHDDVCDYRNARRIINGLDRCDLIKEYADKLEAMLRASSGPSLPS
jgi:putative chitinase